ncbi:YcxB-like protein [Desulfosporosinus hippei DSM 8344]|uniref:YcxB-like protein n=2 Tax=Desulfosporosinus TaxID=79206 RepID=A0A1G8HRE5_9FIRM|nr:YcxB-like protein [Desulfosporosinus hippei DSM 8344]
MNLKYELNKQDLIDFNIFHITYSKLSKRSFFLQRYILSLSFLILPFILRNFSTIPFEYWLTVCILLYLYWVAFFPKRIRKIVTRKISRMLEQGKNQSVIGRHDLTLSNTGIVDLSENSEAKTQYTEIHDIVEDKEHIYIYVNANSAHIIPNRIFENLDKKNEVLALLKQKGKSNN